MCLLIYLATKKLLDIWLNSLWQESDVWEALLLCVCDGSYDSKINYKNFTIYVHHNIIRCDTIYGHTSI